MINKGNTVRLIQGTGRMIGLTLVNLGDKEI